MGRRHQDRQFECELTDHDVITSPAALALDGVTALTAD